MRRNLVHVFQVGFFKKQKRRGESVCRVRAKLFRGKTSGFLSSLRTPNLKRTHTPSFPPRLIQRKRGGLKKNTEKELEILSVVFSMFA